MLYLEYIWVRSEKQSFLWTHSAKIYLTDLPNWPKSLGYRWKKEPSGVRSPCLGPSKYFDCIKDNDLAENTINISAGGVSQELGDYTVCI